MEKTVGVLLSVYRNDNPEWLRSSIDSLLNQTYKDIRIYLGVDGTVNGKLAECLENYKINTSISVIPFSENRGLAAVLNDLIKLCKRDGIEYLARMDADDISLPERFEKQISFLKENQDVDVVGGFVININERSQKVGKVVAYPEKSDDCKKFFRYRDPIPHPCAMFRMSFFDKVGGYRNEFRKDQDTMLWFDGFRSGCVFGNIQEPLLLFRVTDEMFKSRRNGWKRACKMLKVRNMINKGLNYDLSAYVYSYARFVMTISPTWIKRCLYKITR